MVRNVSDRYSIDDSRIYVAGTSMGGQGTMGMVTEHPGIFAAAVATVSVPLPEDASQLDCPLGLFTAEFDGMTEDTQAGSYLPQRVPHHFNFYKNARASGKSVRLTMFCSYGHHVGYLANYYPGLWDWLFAQERK